MMILISLALLGFGVLEAAQPIPNEGCIIKKGAMVVSMPTTRAGTGLGLSNH